MKVSALVHMYPPLHNAGAEHMLHSIMSELVRAGVECTVAIEPYGGDAYKLDGVSVGGRALLEGCDILLTHLDRTPGAEAYSQAHGVPLAQIMHNHQRPGMAKVCHLAIYNSEWISQGFKTRGCEHSVVIHPPILAERYRVKPGKRVTLINLQKAKGVELFYQLAARMPDIKFLGVFGAYGGQQVPPALDNLTLLPQQSDVRRAYEQTRVLLMPSEYESYGRCALEAAVSGIPTIANATAGLREALGESGVFPEKLTAECWEAALRGVLGQWPEHSRRALALAGELAPGADVGRLLAALEETVKRGVVPRRVDKNDSALRYPITIAVPCVLGATRYSKGSRIDRETALALKAAGQLTDSRIV